MTTSIQDFTPSLKMLAQINQKRIKLNKRIFWPDYQVLNLLTTFTTAAQKQQAQLDLSNLFMYCTFEQNFCVKKTNKKAYMDQPECYSEQFTHLAIWMCSKNTSASSKNQLASLSSPSSKSLPKRILDASQKDQIAKSNDQTKELYLVLSKRPIAIDQIIRTNHKISISVAPLSQQKFLWGGNVNFEEFEQVQINKENQQLSLFGNKNTQSFGFNLNAKPNNTQPKKRNVNQSCKRQTRFSNFNFHKNQLVKESNQKMNKQAKDFNNKVKFGPRHIRPHKQFLYIELDITDNPQLPQRSDSYNLFSIDIYGRHMRPKYGVNYDQRSSSDQQNQNQQNWVRKHKQHLKKEIFIIYSMPFMTYSSYIQSQINYEEYKDLKQINYKGPSLMFEAMRNLELKSHGKKNESKQKNTREIQNNKSLSSLSSNNNNKSINSLNFANSNNPLNQKQFKVQKGKQKARDEDQSSSKSLSRSKTINKVNQNEIKNQNINYEIVEIEDQNMKNLNNKTNQKQDMNRKMMGIKKLRQTLISQICSKILNLMNNKVSEKQNKISNQQSIKQSKKNRNNQQNKQQDLVYIPIFNKQGYEPLRVGVRKRFLQYINPQIEKQIIKVQIESDDLYDPQQPNNLMQIDEPYNNNKKKQQTKSNPLIGKIYKGKNYKLIQQINKDPKRKNAIQYVWIDVFLADKVYRKEAVDELIDLVYRFQLFIEQTGLCRNIKQNQFQMGGHHKNNNQTDLFNVNIKQKDLERYFSDIICVVKIQQLKNIFILLQDLTQSKPSQSKSQSKRKSAQQIISKIPQQLKIYKSLQNLIWVQIFTMINQITTYQLQLINIVKQEVSFILQNKNNQKINLKYINQTSNLNYNDNNKYFPEQQKVEYQLRDKERRVIDLITQYHLKTTLNQKLSKMLPSFFIYFLNYQINNHSQFFTYLNNIKLNDQSQSQQNNNNRYKQDKIKDGSEIIRQIVWNYFMLNSKNIIQQHRDEINKIIEELQLKINRQQDQQQQLENKKKEEPQKQIQIDAVYNERQDIGNNQKKNKINKIEQMKIIIKLLKQTLHYTIKNLKQIPINTFLSQPLQQFDQDNCVQSQQDSLPYKQQQYHQYRQIKQDRQNNGQYKSKKLISLLKRYFIRGHNVLQTSKGKTDDLINNTSYVNLITDLLHYYITFTNLQILSQDKISNLDDNQRRSNKINNIIELINYEYHQHTNTNNSFILNKTIKNNKITPIVQFKQLNHNPQNKLNNSSYQNNQINVITQNDYNLAYSSTYQIKHHSNYTYVSNYSNNSVFNNQFNQSQSNSHSKSNSNPFNQQQSNLNNLSNTTIYSNDSQFLHISNTKQPFRLSNNLFTTYRRYYAYYQTLINHYYDFSLAIHPNYLIKQTNPIDSLSLNICFKPTQFPLLNTYQQKQSQSNHSYQINLLNSQFSIKPLHSQKHPNSKCLFSGYHICVQVQLFFKTQNNQNNQNIFKPHQVKQPFSLIYKGSNVIIFDNSFTSTINSQNINLLLDHGSYDSINMNQIKLQHIHKANIKIYSKQIPTLSNALTFINLRLNKYVSQVLNSPQKQSNKIQSNKPVKTIGGRFTEHLSKRKSVLLIQNNMISKDNKEKSSLFNGHQNKTTLFDLPEDIIYHLLNTDKCYIQQQSKILHFIDQFYQVNQPKFSDFILYQTLRVPCLRLTDVLKNYLQYPQKYQTSVILKNLIKNKISFLNKEKISNQMKLLLNQKIRVSSQLPLKNLKDTLEQRQLLSKYMKNGNKRNSSQKNHSTQVAQNNQSAFIKKNSISSNYYQNNQKDVEI